MFRLAKDLSREEVDCYLGGYSSDAEAEFEEISRYVKRYGFDKEILIRLAVWKGRSRIRPLIERNSEQNVRMVTAFALGIHDERMKVRLLCCLDGVSVPVASAILTAWDSKSYGVIDKYAWLSLTGRSGPLTEDEWLFYLEQIRVLAERHGKTPREMDKTLMMLGQRAEKERFTGITVETGG